MWKKMSLSNMGHPINFAQGLFFVVVCCGLETADVNNIF